MAGLPPIWVGPRTERERERGIEKILQRHIGYAKRLLKRTERK